MPRARDIAVAAFGCTLAIASPCRADAGDIAAAQSLFDAGKQAMAAKDYATACPKLAESYRLDPVGGTAFALALCNEAAGKTATAWGDFNQALAIARRDHRSDRESAALTHIASLEKRLVRIHIVVGVDAPNLEIHRDGALVGRAQWGAAVPIDPGQHVVEASAPDKKPWKQTLATGAEGSTLEVAVPALEDDVKAPPPQPPVVSAPTQTAPPAAPTQSAPPAFTQEPEHYPKDGPPGPDEGASRKTIAYVVGGVGIAGLAAGTVLGLMAQSQWSSTSKACPGNTCTKASDQSAGKTAGSLADGATVAFIAGGALVAAGAVLYLTAPSPSNQQRALRIGPAVGVNSFGLSFGGEL